MEAGSVAIKVEILGLDKVEELIERLESLRRESVTVVHNHITAPSPPLAASAPAERGVSAG